MRLQHLHLPGLTRYESVSRLQNQLVRTKISSHHPTSTSPSPASASPSLFHHDPVSPSLITYASTPTYTSGRRQILNPSQISVLEHDPASNPANDAVYVHSARGGLLTFHGPGQLTAYPILHLRTHGLAVRSYISLLEAAIVRTLAHYGVRGFTRPEYPGVWVNQSQKIASVGVHVQRGVTCFGTGLNVATDRMWWDRFTACGIDGVQMVAMSDLGVQEAEGLDAVTKVAHVFAGEMAEALDGVDGVDWVHEEEGKSFLRTVESEE